MEKERQIEVNRGREGIFQSCRQCFGVSRLFDCNLIKREHNPGGERSGMVRVCAKITACCCFVHVSDMRCCWYRVCVYVRERERERE